MADNLHVKNQKYQLIPSRDIDDQRILQSDWTKVQLTTLKQR